MSVDAKLGLNVFKADKTSHIEIDEEVCRAQCRKRHCLYVCPAQVFTWSDELDRVHIRFEGCLECTTCGEACQHQALTWRHPQGGCGVQYRFG